MRLYGRLDRRPFFSSQEEPERQLNNDMDELAEFSKTNNNVDDSIASLYAIATGAYTHQPSSQPTESMMCYLYIFNATAAILASPCLERVGNPARNISLYIVSLNLKLLNFIVTCSLFLLHIYINIEKLIN